MKTQHPVPKKTKPKPRKQTHRHVPSQPISPQNRLDCYSEALVFLSQTIRQNVLPHILRETQSHEVGAASRCKTPLARNERLDRAEGLGHAANDLAIVLAQLPSVLAICCDMAGDMDYDHVCDDPLHMIVCHLWLPRLWRAAQESR